MVARGIAVFKQQPIAAQAVERGGEAERVAESAHQVGGHAFHQHHHHVLPSRLPFRLYAARYGRHIFQRLRLAFQQIVGSVAQSLIVGHEREAAVFGPQFVEGAVQHVESGVEPHLVDGGIVAKVCRAHFYGIIAQPAANAEEASTAEQQ